MGRRRLLGLAGGLAGSVLASGCGLLKPAAPKPAAGAPKPERHHYGPGSQQFGDLYRPRENARPGTVVVIHGGFWQSSYDLSLGAALSADLADRGWTAWNIEYARLGNGGGWPGTFTDVAAAVDQLVDLDGVDHSRVVAVGHSAGGQLAVWSAGRDSRSPGGAPRTTIRGVLSQAGVLDLRAAVRSGLGGSSVVDLVGGTPRRFPQRYAEVDPVEGLPIDAPVRCIHGRDDSTVPISQSQAYVKAAVAAGGDARLVEVDGDHFSLIDPTSSAWKHTVALLPGLFR